ncbi:MFS transporter [Desmonostoc muscorum LEGE 12446]|uniref:MFS transporter n=1 Tax=Desmonostoc muscorum LEGE 12446 TaxID=1828758 RepID=A0A8J7DC46_DESMC|nr:MFS transporter [Desmonostoc muscorum]MCF2149632.1 MFS transporter [Desmonostoc muscorum LEGE 12446]
MKVAQKIPSDSIFSNGLSALYIISFLSGVSLGFFNPFISTLMAQNQVDDILIGANSTVYFLVIALVTPFVTKLLRKFGLRKTMISGLVLMAFSASLFPMTTEVHLWFLIRILMGIACCLYLVSGQTGLNYFSHEGNRGMVNGINALALTFGFGVGPLVGSSLYQISPQLSFCFGSLVILSGVIVVWIGLPQKILVSQTSTRANILSKVQLPLVGAFAYGFAESTLISLYPVFLLKQNYSIDKIGSTFAIFLVGGLISTVPFAYIGDKYGRLKTLLAAVCIVLFSFILLSFSENITATSIFSFTVGVGIAPIFPLALALIGENVSRNEISSGTARFMQTYSFGCTAGPIFSSVVMQNIGERYIFSLVIVGLAIFSSCIVRKMTHIKTAG